jgi:periplasmic protein TonB
MDSNSTLVTEPHDILREGECRLERNQFAMDTYHDICSESSHLISYPVVPRPQLRVDSRIEALPKHEKEQRSIFSGLHEGDLFYDSLIVSGGKSRRRNLWAGLASVSLLSLLLLALILIPLFHTDVLLPERRTVTMLYVPPAAAASNVTKAPAPTSTLRNTQPKMIIPSAVPTTQEAPATPLATAGGVVGGVPGGVVGGMPGGVISDLLRSTGTAPVLAKTTAPAPKRIRVPAPTAEANLVYDVAPKYPPEAGRERIEGIVVLVAVIGKDGTVRDVRVESGLPLLAQAAIEAVKQWRYRPYFLNGEPVEIDSLITINFKLSRG